MTQHDKTMLALAALTYRGFGNQSEKTIEQALRPWLKKLPSEGLGQWDLVWGPASFRVPTSLVDDSMVYVARDSRSENPPRYAVAIRGTNPVSVFDWVFADFWVSLQIPWDIPPATDAALSASSALGLEIIRHLAADTPASEQGGLAAFGDTLIHALERFSADLPELVPARLLAKPDELPNAALISRINTLLQREGETLRSRVIGGLLRGLRLPSLEQSVFDALKRQIADATDKGEQLLAFIDRVVPPGAIIAVTGHSKGGALAAATALWLEETWAFEKQVRIECFSFAGPTPGNSAFAERYNKRLAERTRLVVNPRDIVPQAWVPAQLRTLEKFYPELKLALDVVIPSVADLGYTHVAGEIVAIKSQAAGSSLIADLIYQHLDAYLNAAQFESPDWNSLIIFTGH
jgi:hypothetical protein